MLSVIYCLLAHSPPLVCLCPLMLAFQLLPHLCQTFAFFPTHAKLLTFSQTYAILINFCPNFHLFPNLCQTYHKKISNSRQTSHLFTNLSNLNPTQIKLSPFAQLMPNLLNISQLFLNFSPFAPSSPNLSTFLLLCPFIKFTPTYLIEDGEISYIFVFRSVIFHMNNCKNWVYSEEVSNRAE